MNSTKKNGKKETIKNVVKKEKTKKNVAKKTKVKKEKHDKSELLEIMNEHLSTQQEFALILKEKARKYIKGDDENGDDKKKRNSYLNTYNQQVDAVSRTVSSLIKINSSSIENEENEEESSNSLVD